MGNWKVTNLDHRWKNTKILPHVRAILKGLSFRRKKLGSSVAAMQRIQLMGNQSQYGLQIMFWEGLLGFTLFLWNGSSFGWCITPYMPRLPLSSIFVV